jgi:hypothetical protein
MVDDHRAVIDVNFRRLKPDFNELSYFAGEPEIDEYSEDNKKPFHNPLLFKI